MWRLAQAADAGQIATIYNQGIEDRVATFETRLRSEEEMRNWLAARGERYAVLVAVEEQEAVTGYASLNPYSVRECYAGVADISIYIRRDARGRGIGGELMQALVETAEGHGFHKMLLSAFPENAAGIALYRRYGFREVGRFEKQARLDGVWRDVVHMEKLLSAARAR